MTETNPCDGIQCSNYATCRVDENGMATCKCPNECPAESSNVCGSDGKTYRNLCTLEMEACKTKMNITVAGNMACGKYTLFFSG